MELRDALEKLTQKSHVAIHSTAELSGAVARYIAKQDEKRSEEEKPGVPRKPAIGPVPSAEHQSGFKITPWDLLQTFGRATTLSGQNPSRGLSQHWNCLRYLTTLEAHGGRMALSPDGHDPRYHRKGVQAQELGAAFSLIAAQNILQRRHSGYRFEPVDVDLALDAGWALRGQGAEAKGTRRSRPGHFLVGRKAGEPLRIALVDGRGSHGQSSAQHNQLMASAERVQVITLGDGRGSADPLPSLLMSTAFVAEGGIEIRLLDPVGGGVLAEPGKPTPDPYGPVQEENFFPDIRTVDAQGRTSGRPGFHITSDRFEWFSRVLVRASAAALLTFVGDRDNAYKYLTVRQQRRLGADHSPQAVNAECDVRVELGGITFVGTDHVFRFARERVEVFSAMPKELHEILKTGDGTRAYAEKMPEVVAKCRSQWAAVQRDWTGIITMDGDGAVMALRVLKSKGRPLEAIPEPREGRA